jgi:hypothetical protein
MIFGMTPFVRDEVAHAGHAAGTAQTVTRFRTAGT